MCAVRLSVFGGIGRATKRLGFIAKSHPAEHDELRWYHQFSKSFPMIEAALPAKVPRDDAVATWVREHGAAVDVHTSEELAIAIANGVKPSRIVVHGDELGDRSFEPWRLSASAR